MKGVELYARVRRAVVVEGKSQRAVAREFGIDRKRPMSTAVFPGLRVAKVRPCSRG